MKKIYRIGWFWLTLAGCTAWGFARMPAQDSVKKEIEEAIGTIFRDLQNMDAESLYQSYAESPEFIQITTEGAMFDFQLAKNLHERWFGILSSLKVTTENQIIRILPGNTVICSWFGKMEMATKQGAQLKTDAFGITFIFRKVDGKWKVIHQQGSSLPPVQVKI